MKQHSGAVGRLGALKLLIHRFAFTAMVVSAFALMVLGKADAVLVERIRTSIGDALAPALDLASRPVSTIAEVIDHFRELKALHAENARLREENQRLMRWQTLARRLDHDNQVLRGQLAAVADPALRFATARVVADTGGAFAHSMLVAAGARDGARKGMAVLAGEALAGRVVEVGVQSARLLLLTDINSRIPVVTETSRSRAILSGDNSERPVLAYLGDGVVVAPGERVVTSGHGGAFPPGIPVGVVAAVSEGAVRVELFVDRHRLEVVTIADYDLDADPTLPARTGTQPTDAP